MGVYEEVQGSRSGGKRAEEKKAGRKKEEEDETRQGEDLVSRRVFEFLPAGNTLDEGRTDCSLAKVHGASAAIVWLMMYLSSYHSATTLKSSTSGTGKSKGQKGATPPACPSCTYELSHGTACLIGKHDRSGHVRGYGICARRRKRGNRDRQPRCHGNIIRQSRRMDPVEARMLCRQTTTMRFTYS